MRPRAGNSNICGCFFSVVALSETTNRPRTIENAKDSLSTEDYGVEVLHYFIAVVEESRSRQPYRGRYTYVYVQRYRTCERSLKTCYLTVYDPYSTSYTVEKIQLFSS